MLGMLLNPPSSGHPVRFTMLPAGLVIALVPVWHVGSAVTSLAKCSWLLSAFVPAVMVSVPVAVGVSADVHVPSLLRSRQDVIVYVPAFNSLIVFWACPS